MGRSTKGYIQLPRRLPAVKPLPDLARWKAAQGIVDPIVIDPAWEAKAARRKAIRARYEQRPYVKRMRAIQATPVTDRLTKTEWREILERYFYRCYYCFGYSKTALTQDHYIPVSKGGKHVKANIVPACQSCNSMKGNRPADWYNPFSDR